MKSRISAPASRLPNVCDKLGIVRPMAPSSRMQRGALHPILCIHCPPSEFLEPKNAANALPRFGRMGKEADPMIRCLPLLRLVNWTVFSPVKRAPVTLIHRPFPPDILSTRFEVQSLR